MEELMEFEGVNVGVIQDENGEPLFELYSTGMALGYVKYNTVGKIYPRKDRINRVVENAEISTVVQGDEPFINLNNLKKFISISHTMNRLKFIEWLAKNEFVSYDEIFNSTRKEILFLNELEYALIPFNLKGIKQYKVLNYRIDYYIPTLNIAIEYDENNHNNYSYEAHEGRQKAIENKLKCKFIRVSDKNNLGYNLGLVIKNILDIKESIMNELMEFEGNQAENFQDWGMNKTLPTIKKTGGGFVAKGNEKDFIYSHFLYLSDEVKKGMIRDLTGEELA